MRRVVVAAVVAADLALVGGALAWNASRGTSRPVPAPSAWDRLGPQARCDAAAFLVSQPNPWPTSCRWREPTDGVQGAAFPPPPGEPPFDRPRIEIYVERGQTRPEVAHAIAHELGHMHHTREFPRAAEWLAARGLAADTPWQAWTEDYAEVFAALFGPPVDAWRAPTSRPGPDALAALRAQFFG